jgi:uncharacterized protein YrrD
MRKGKTVIGQDVLSLATGKKIQTVKDLILGESTQIVALLVDEGGLLSTSTVIPIEMVRRFGKDAVIVESDDAVIKASADPDVAAILNRKDSLVGKRVFSVDGQELGKVADLYFDEVSGRIDGIEISGGTVADIASGTSYLQADEIQLAGQDIVFVPTEAAARLQQQVGGIQGALGTIAETAKATVSDTDDNVRAMADETARRQQEEREQALIGHRSGTQVTDENGAVVVAKGQLITEEIVERARATNNLSVLIHAADTAEAEDSQAALAEATDKVADTTGDLWDRFTAKLGELTDSAGQKVDERETKQRLNQIHDAIGRPVTKVILDRDDNVVLDLGDIITHQAVQQAYDSGMLDTLLESVYRGQVDFQRDEMKARADAQATVEKATGGATLVDDLAHQVEQTEQQDQRDKDEAKAKADAEREQRTAQRRLRARRRDAGVDQDQAPRAASKTGSPAR